MDDHLGRELYPRVALVNKVLAGKITGMLLVKARLDVLPIAHTS